MPYSARNRTHSGFNVPSGMIAGNSLHTTGAP